MIQTSFLISINMDYIKVKKKWKSTFIIQQLNKQYRKLCLQIGLLIKEPIRRSMTQIVCVLEHLQSN